jgi:hypothetical protein
MAVSGGAMLLAWVLWQEDRAVMRAARAAPPVARIGSADGSGVV